MSDSVEIEASGLGKRAPDNSVNVTHLVGLGELRGGAGIVLFDQVLCEVLDNIADINYKADAKRSVMLKVDIKPLDESRHFCQVDISCSSKLAPRIALKTGIHVHTRELEGKILTSASEYYPEQTSLFG